MEAHRSTAFTAALPLDRRHQGGATGPAITSVALSASGQRLYLGLEDGVLEEHAIQASQGARASLAARKHAAKRVRRRCRLLDVAAAAAAAATAVGVRAQPAYTSLKKTGCSHFICVYRRSWASTTWPRWAAAAAAAALPCWFC